MQGFPRVIACRESFRPCGKTLQLAPNVKSRHNRNLPLDTLIRRV